MPIDRGILDQQLQALGESARWWDTREMRDLPAVLDAGEQVVAISRGKIARVRVLRWPWLIVVTDRRLACIRSSRTTWRQMEIDADHIARVSLRVGPFRGRVTVFADGEKYRLLVPRLDAYKLMSALSSIGTPLDESFLRSGSSNMVRRVVDHVLALPAAALEPAAPPRKPVARPPVVAAMDQRVDALENEVEQLRKQVDFLEQLLKERQST
jgi:hypothetical protein